MGFKQDTSRTQSQARQDHERKQKVGREKKMVSGYRMGGSGYRYEGGMGDKRE
jgi:hypothetical protein